MTSCDRTVERAHIRKVGKDRRRILIGALVGAIAVFALAVAVSLAIQTQAKSQNYQLEGCRQSKVVYTILRTRPALVKALVDQNLLPPGAAAEANATNTLLPLQNCAASLATGKRVLLTPEQTEFVMHEILGHRRLPIYDVDGHFDRYLPLPLGAEQ